MSKYYWVLFEVLEGYKGHINKRYTTELTTNHPIQLCIDNNKFDWEDGVKRDFDLIYWKELTEDEYKQFEDMI